MTMKQTETKTRKFYLHNLEYTTRQGLNNHSISEGNGPVAYIQTEDSKRGKELLSLIAAAPDLLEACKFALDSGDDLEAIRKLEAAIKKATGE